MSIEDDTDDRSIADAVLISPPEEDEKAELLSRSFQPWHLPRKHYIRIHQWCSLVQKLFRGRKDWYSENGAAYLTLPGDDLLDVRALEGVCTRAGVKLRYLGYNQLSPKTQRSFASDLAVHELQNRPHVDADRSRVIHERIENVSNVESIAYRELQRTGPFSIINLDLCDSLGKDPPSSAGSMLAAIRELLELQSAAGSPWLLFLTTRSNRTGIDSATLSKLIEIVSNNLKGSAEFREKMKGVIIDVHAVAEGVSESDQTSRLVSLGVGKWLLSMGLSGATKWRIELLESYWYSVHGGQRDMLSLAFRFERSRTVSDDTGLTADTSAQSSVPSEAEQALAMLDGVRDLRDPDEILRNDKDLLQKTVQQSRRILEEAHFDVDAYEHWLATKS